MFEWLTKMPAMSSPNWDFAVECWLILPPFKYNQVPRHIAARLLLYVNLWKLWVKSRNLQDFQDPIIGIASRWICTHTSNCKRWVRMRRTGFAWSYLRVLLCASLFCSELFALLWYFFVCFRFFPFIFIFLCNSVRLSHCADMWTFTEIPCIF